MKQDKIRQDELRQDIFLSTGDESTLGAYKKLCTLFFGPESKSVKFLDKKIHESIHGEGEQVLQHESQMMQIFMSLETNIQTLDKPCQ